MASFTKKTGVVDEVDRQSKNTTLFNKVHLTSFDRAKDRLLGGGDYICVWGSVQDFE